MKNFLEKVQKNGQAGRKRSDSKSHRTKQKNKRGDSKVESNDSPEIPDRGETSDIPGLSSGVKFHGGSVKTDGVMNMSMKAWVISHLQRLLEH